MPSSYRTHQVIVCCWPDELIRAWIPRQYWGRRWGFREGTSSNGGGGGGDISNRSSVSILISSHDGMYKFDVLSLNTAGIGDSFERRKVFNYLKKSCSSKGVLFLQETQC